MRRIIYGCWLGLCRSLLAGEVNAQQPTGRLLVVSPVVGSVIDQQEKATYGLFLYYAADDFVEARFEQTLAPDSTIQLRTLLRNGQTVMRLFTPAELAAVRTTIETRHQELSRLPVPKPSKTSFAGGVLKPDRRFRVELRSGAVFDGDLIAQYRTRLEFFTADSLRVVERATIKRLEQLNTRLDRHPTGRFDIGNGHRLFLMSTARNLRRREGYLQNVSTCVLGGGYGLTDYFSVGLVFSAIPVLPTRSQFLIFTPKVSVPLAKNWHVGGGLLYIRVPDYLSVSENEKPFGIGVSYGTLTYGSADNNLSVGLGYGMAGAGVNDAPVGLLGGQKRVSRRLSIVSENYLLANADPGILGLYGVRLNWRRTNLGLGGLYALPFHGREDALVTGLPIWIDFAFRFGRGSR